MWWMTFADPNAEPPGNVPPNAPPLAPPAPVPPAEGGADDALQEAPEDDRESVGTGVLAVLGSVGPWALSFVLHLGLVVVALVIVWGVIQEQKKEEQIIADLVFSEKPGAPISMTQKQEVQKPSSKAQRSLVKTKQEKSTISSQVKVTPVSIAQTGGALSKSNPFGAVSTGDGAFATSFAGNPGGNARTIVFVIDASGSLIDTLPFVINELRDSLTKMSPQQRFSVIFFQDGDVIEVPPAGLKPVTDAAVIRALEWMAPSAGNIVPQGTTSPIPAIRAALRLRPQLIYVLSDNITGQGQFEWKQEDLVREVERANVARTKISTIQFLYPDRLTAYGMQPTLQKIAESTGGRYRFVDAGDLGFE